VVQSVMDVQEREARDRIVQDLSFHASDKVNRILEDAICLVDHPADQALIALALACNCIGASGAFFAMAAELRGAKLDKVKALSDVLELLKLVVQNPSLAGKMRSMLDSKILEASR
jgi:hypothetical protein